MSYSSQHVAGIVCLNSKSDEASLVSWASGNYFNQNPPDGSILNDLYAEILARRGFLTYLLNQVEKYINSDGKDSIFMLNEETKLLRVKDDYSFHLFVSGAPIGDGCRVSYNENDFSNAIFPTSDCYIGHGLGQLSVKKSGKGLFL